MTSVAILRSPSKPFRSKGDRNMPPFRNALTRDPALASYSHISLRAWTRYLCSSLPSSRAIPFPIELVLFHPLLSHPLSSKNTILQAPLHSQEFQEASLLPLPLMAALCWHGLRHTYVLAIPHECSLGNIWHCSELFHVKYFLYPQLKQ